MTVKDIFALRKQGRIEEAYEAIRPIYREHKGKYTTLCMFWTAADVFKLRLEQKRVEEAEKIYEALKRMLPRIEEIEASDDQPHHKGQARGFMKFAEGRLIKASEKFQKRYFAMRDKKKRIQAQTAATASPDEGINIPSDVPSELAVIPSESPDVIPSNVEESLEECHPEHGRGISPCATLSRDDNGISPCATLSRDDNAFVMSSVVETSLNKGQQSVLEAIKAHPGLRVPGIETETGIPAKSIERHIKVLIERNLIEHRGSKKTGGYYANNQ